MGSPRGCRTGVLNLHHAVGAGAAACLPTGKEGGKGRRSWGVARILHPIAACGNSIWEAGWGMVAV